MLHPADMSVLWSFSSQSAASKKYGAGGANAAAAAAATEKARLKAQKEKEERELKVVPKDWISYRINSGSSKFSLGQVHTVCKRFKGWYNVRFYAKGKEPLLLQVQMTPRTFHSGVWKFSQAPSTAEMTTFAGKKSAGGVGSGNGSSSTVARPEKKRKRARPAQPSTWAAQSRTTGRRYQL